MFRSYGRTNERFVCYTSLIQLLLLKTTGTQVRAYAQKLLNLVHIDTQEKVVLQVATHQVT